MDTRLRVRCAEQCLSSAPRRGCSGAKPLPRRAPPDVQLPGRSPRWRPRHDCPAPRVQSTESSSFPGVMPPALL